MVALAVAVLITFIGGLYFIAHNKSEEAVILPNHGNHSGNGLPPKPEERWRYIKELENRQIGVQTPTEPSAGGEVQSPAQLTDEQRQLLEQMQADMRQQPTHLNEVPYNDQTRASVNSKNRPSFSASSETSEPAPTRQTSTQTLYTPRQTTPPDTEPMPRQAQPYQPQMNAVSPPHVQSQAAAATQLHAQQQQAAAQLHAQQQAAAATQLHSQQQAAAAQLHSQQQAAAAQLHSQQQAAAAAAAHSRQTAAAGQIAAQPKPVAPPKDKGQRWLIQCGTFKAADQAESVRAQLAFSGIESRIANSGGWKRVMLGPYATRASADKSLQDLRGSGVPIASGG
jgi:cell division protein FtsN